MHTVKMEPCENINVNAIDSLGNFFKIELRFQLTVLKRFPVHVSTV